ncbi:MAG: acyl carrier protein [Candidatus Margulisbacteria bacterium]|nr:acyl carrier protein [Candidatus Margulisiibacteriota bacterium]
MGNEQEIITLIAKVIKVPQEKIGLETDIFQDLGVDSLLGVEIFAALDKKYNLDIPESRLENITTVGDIVDLVAELRAKPAQ